MGGVWSLDEKVGTTYAHKEVANTLNLSTVQKLIYEVGEVEHESESIRLRPGSIERCGDTVPAGDIKDIE